MIIWGIFSILIIPLPPRSLVVGLFSLCDCLILRLILAGFPAVSSGVISLLTSLKQFHVAVHLPCSVLNELHHLTDDLDLLVPQLLTSNQGSLDAVQHSSLLHSICLPFKFFIVIIQVLQNLCKEKTKTVKFFVRENGKTKPPIFLSTQQQLPITCSADQRQIPWSSYLTSSSWLLWIIFVLVGPTGMECKCWFRRKDWLNIFLHMLIILPFKLFSN